MYISRLRAASSARRDVDFMRRLNHPWHEHRQMWSFFEGDPDQERDFLYRRMSERGVPEYMLVSPQRPQPNDTQWEVETKPYNPDLRRGDRLFFSLYFNSAVRSGGSRHDVVMHRKHQLKDEGIPREEWPPQNQLVQEEGTDWLKRREEHGGYNLDEDSVLVLSHDRESFKKGNSDRTVVLATMEAQGELTVDDPDSFRSILFEGIGPGKAYGCGLMLVERV